ncbi:MAG: hypothetical protein BWY83_02458 [bacterium ADurb.Bin478]|nr:MAG: hypothetical protein BWY83_02458 [bacterium ADurb.Bin478]
MRPAAACCTVKRSNSSQSGFYPSPRRRPLSLFVWPIPRCRRESDGCAGRKHRCSGTRASAICWRRCAMRARRPIRIFFSCPTGASFSASTAPSAAPRTAKTCGGGATARTGRCLRRIMRPDWWRPACCWIMISNCAMRSAAAFARFCCLIRSTIPCWRRCIMQRPRRPAAACSSPHFGIRR